MSSEPNYRSLAREAMERHADYVRRLDDQYAERREYRKREGIPVLAFCGHGRHGKDQSAEFLAKGTRAHYIGSVSKYVLPLVASAKGLSEKEAWTTRHNHRQFWREFCDALRWDDPALLARMVLSSQDCITGIRATAEFWTSWGEEHIDQIIWVQREGFPDDPTMQYRLETFQHLGFGRCGHRGYQIIDNNRDLDHLEKVVMRTAQYLGVPLT